MNTEQNMFSAWRKYWLKDEEHFQRDRNNAMNEDVLWMKCLCVSWFSSAYVFFFICEVTHTTEYFVETRNEIISVGMHAWSKYSIELAK